MYDTLRVHRTLRTIRCTLQDRAATPVIIRDVLLKAYVELEQAHNEVARQKQRARKYWDLYEWCIKKLRDLEETNGPIRVKMHGNRRKMT